MPKTGMNMIQPLCRALENKRLAEKCKVKEEKRQNKNKTLFQFTILLKCLISNNISFILILKHKIVIKLLKLKKL